MYRTLRFAILFIIFSTVCMPAVLAQEAPTAADEQPGSKENARISSPPDEMFIDMKIPAHQLYIGETMLIEYNVLVTSRRGSIDYSGDDPDFVNWNRIEAPTSKEMQVSVNGKPYVLMPFGAYFVTPTKIGKLPLPTIKIQIPFLSTKPWITHATRFVEVIPLPDPIPSDFELKNIGNFSLKASLSKTEAHIGDIIVANIELKSDTSSSGLSLHPYNLTDASSAFHVYPITKDSAEESIANGKLSSTVRFKMKMLAVKEGTWTIDPFKIVTFNPKQHQYKTISTDPMTIKVDAEGTLPDESTTRIHSSKIDAHHIREIHLAKVPYDIKIPYWSFLIGPLFLLSLILASLLKQKLAKGKLEQEQYDSLMKLLEQFSNAETANEQYTTLSTILNSLYGVPVKRQDADMRLLLSPIFGDENAQIITVFLRDLRMTTYSSHQPLDKDKTSPIVDIFNKNLPMRESHD